MTLAVPVLPPYPDAEAIVIAYLNANEMNAAGSLPNDPVWPCLVVTRIGGSPVVRWSVDQPNLQIDVWGASKADARDAAALAQNLLDRIPNANGTAALAGAWVSDSTTSDLIYQPDDENPIRYRYHFDALITLRAS